MLYNIITGLLLAGLGLYATTQIPAGERDLAILMILSGPGSMTKLWGYITKSKLLFTYKTFRLLCVIHGSILVLFVFKNWGQAPFMQLAILLGCFYSYAFFKAKQDLKTSP